MKFSVIIPTYNHLQDCLIPCLESIKKYTDPNLAEIIVVANGCTDGTREYVENLGHPFKLLWFDDALGYTKATNEGIKSASGEYIVLLNNDTELTPQVHNRWLDLLAEPFADPKVGISGPMKTFCPEARRNFLIFFCVCIKKEMFEKTGLLDEIFSPGYGEDSDFCAKLENLGYKIFQVCPSDTYSNESNKVMLGAFPIWHKGNQTFKNWPGGEELLKRNNKTLFERYGQFEPDISKAQKCDGFMSNEELRWLGKEAKKRKIIVEIGSWHGKSSRAIGDNLMPGGILYCVDTWNGSTAEQDSNHLSAKWKDGDHAYYEYLQNMFDLIENKKVIPLRMSSKNAASFFREKGITFDMIFIDGGHEYHEVCEDIDAWKEIIKDDGIFCGHDFNAWAGVNQAASDKLISFGVGENTTIWYTDRNNIHFDPPKIFDCFILNNELDLLELRLNSLWNTVDRFIICEAKKTHSGQNKPLYFNDNLKRFEKFLSKITYSVIEDFSPGDSWHRERTQRNHLLNSLTSCKASDCIIISDLDEIPSVEAIKSYSPEQGIMSFSMDLYYYNFHTRAVDKWNEAKIAPYRLVRELSPCGIRYTSAPLIKNGGQHLSYFCFNEDIELTIDRIVKKIEDTAHTEYSTPYFKDRERIRKAILNGTDIFERSLKFEDTRK